MPLRFSLIASLLLALVLPINASPTSPTNLRSDILYTSRGEFVQVSPMHPLTLNAYIQQFAYEPLGIKVAFAGSEVQGDQTIHFVKTMDVRTGREMSRYTLAVPTTSVANALTRISLLGWSVSGKYLLLQRYASASNQPDDYREEYLRWDLTANPLTMRPIDPAAYLPAGTVAMMGDGSVIVSPTH